MVGSINSKNLYLQNAISFFALALIRFFPAAYNADDYKLLVLLVVLLFRGSEGVFVLNNICKNHSEETLLIKMSAKAQNAYIELNCKTFADNAFF